MKKFFSNLFSSGPGIAMFIITIAGIFVLIFHEDNKSKMIEFSSNEKISPQEEILELKEEIKEIEVKIQTIKKEEK